ncbi:MAG: hypothetical protein HIU57_09275, partial [Acidobacteria bacterium]|nr:hypothetical protein [Acidobacteriota bacterium]
MTTPTLTTNSRWRLARVRWSGLVVWMVLLLLIIVPVMTFIAVAVSPRLFHQGSSYFTLSNVAAALQGYTGRGIVDSLWVSTLVGVFAVSVATVIAWLVQRTNVYGRRVWSGAMWLLLLVPTWMTTLGWTDVVAPGELGSALGVHTL